MINKRFIMLVEDNRDDEELTIRALKKNNIMNDIFVARDGAEAIDFLFGQGKYQGRNSDDLPIFILLDLKLPKVDGTDVLKRIREDKRTCYIPVIILTSSKEDQDLTKTYSLGANSFVRKPVDFKEFVETVKNLGLYWMVLNIAPHSK